LHEYILSYSKGDIQSIEVPLSDEEQKKYNNKDEKFLIRGGYITQPLATKSKDDRPNLVYPINHNSKNIWPDKQWIWSKERLYTAIKNNEVVVNEKKGKFSVRFKQYLKNENGVLRKGKPLSFMIGPFNQEGTKEIKQLFMSDPFGFPKPTALIAHFLNVTINGINLDNSLFIDYFAGSGTTAHAVIDLNREDNGNRKYILVEMGEYFDTVLKPRIQKVIYSKDWKNGKPVFREGSSHMFKYIRLESYEDTLNNLELKRTDKQMKLLFGDAMSKKAKEEYMLSYMLDVESKGSLLNINLFENPFNYMLNIATNSVGETKPTTVDLVETFNYLIGLTIKHIDYIQGFCVVEGTNPKEEKVLVIWRNTKEKSNKDLETFFRKQDYNTKDMKFDLIYVNGDNNLENIKRPDETWKVRLIEEEFKRLMFDVEDI